MQKKGIYICIRFNFFKQMYEIKSVFDTLDAVYSWNALCAFLIILRILT